MCCQEYTSPILMPIENRKAVSKRCSNNCGSCQGYLKTTTAIRSIKAPANPPAKAGETYREVSCLFLSIKWPRIINPITNEISLTSHHLFHG